jgi:hypothetical protein
LRHVGVARLVGGVESFPGRKGAGEGKNSVNGTVDPTGRKEDDERASPDLQKLQIFNPQKERPLFTKYEGKNKVV